jgi:hypothetical protein
MKRGGAVFLPGPTYHSQFSALFYPSDHKKFVIEFYPTHDRLDTPKISL